MMDEAAGMDDRDGLICAVMLDGKGGGREVGWDAIRAWKPGDAPIWIHLDRSHPGGQRWLRDESGLDAVTCEALLAEETRPRSVVEADGLIVILRGVNLHPGSEPEDMVSVRLWVDAQRIVTLRARPVNALQDLREALAQKRGPKDPPDLLVSLAAQLVERMGPVLEELDASLDDLEEAVLSSHRPELRTALADLRRQAIALRRYIAPQRDATARLQIEEIPWLTTLHRVHLREVVDRVTRYVEDLDAARERAAVTQEELTSRLAEQMNKTMYVLSLVAAVFLPLSLITGLLGINVAGIPGAEFKWAFAIVCLVLVVIGAAQIVLFRRKKWL